MTRPWVVQIRAAIDTGFVLKSHAGKVIYVDPYLSDLVERLAGLKRLSLAPLDAEDVRADWVVSTHEHEDHLDIDALPVIARQNPGCLFAGPVSCREGYEQCGIGLERRVLLCPGERCGLGDVVLHTARADHGELSPSALSLLFDFDGVSVMFSGDTALTVDYLQPLIDLHPDVLISCINGGFGNMNALDAARLTSRIRPKVAIPSHFWMFKEHHTTEHGDPQSFVRACAELCRELQVEVLSPGRGALVDGQGLHFIIERFVQ